MNEESDTPRERVAHHRVPDAGADGQETLAGGRSARLRWLDVVKGVAIAAVVIGHTVKAGMTVRDVVFSFHMPLFFFAAGYTFRPKSWASLVASSVKRLLVPYVLLVAVSLLPVVSASSLPVKTRMLALAQALVYPAGYPSAGWMDYRMWFGITLERIDGGFYGVGMAWFLWVLFLGRLIVNAVVQIRREAIRLVAAFAILVVGTATAQTTGAYLPFDFDLGCMAAGFMYAGYRVRERRLVRPSMLPLALGAGAIWSVSVAFAGFEMSSRDFAFPALAVLGALAASYVLCYLARLTENTADKASLGAAAVSRIADALAWLGRNSLLVFCIHGIDTFFFGWSALAPALQAQTFLGFESAAVAMGCVRLGFDLCLVALIRSAR